MSLTLLEERYTSTQKYVTSVQKINQSNYSKLPYHFTFIQKLKFTVLTKINVLTHRLLSRNFLMLYVP